MRNNSKKISTRIDQTTQFLEKDHVKGTFCFNFKITPLIQAALDNNLNECLLLLENKANPNDMTLNGKTALHIATIKENIPMMKALLQYGANPVGAYIALHKKLTASKQYKMKKQKGRTNKGSRAITEQIALPEPYPTPLGLAIKQGFTEGIQLLEPLTPSDLLSQDEFKLLFEPHDDFVDHATQLSSQNNKKTTLQAILFPTKDKKTPLQNLKLFVLMLFFLIGGGVGIGFTYYLRPRTTMKPEISPFKPSETSPPLIFDIQQPPSSEVSPRVTRDTFAQAPERRAKKTNSHLERS